MNNNIINLKDVIKDSAPIDFACFTGYTKNTSTAYNAFSGFDYLKVITFSYGLDFLRRVATEHNFKKIDVIIGCQAIVKANGFELAYATENEFKIKLSRNQDLVDLINKDILHFYILSQIIAHEKLYILSNDSNDNTRVFFGSSNLSSDAWNDNQREFRGYCDDFEFYKESLQEFECLKQLRLTELTKDSIYVNIDEDGNISPTEMISCKEVKTKDIDVIFENRNDEETKYLIDISNQIDNIRTTYPKPPNDKGKILITPDYIRKIEKIDNERKNEDKVQKATELVFNFEEHTAILSGKKLDFNIDKDKARDSIQCFFEFMNGYYKFTSSKENIEKAIDTYYKIFIIFLLSPFVPYIRYEFHKYGFDYKSYPYITIIYGAQNAGKSTFIEMMQKFIYNKKLKKIICSKSFKSSEVQKYLLANKGVALHFSELDKSKFTTNNNGEKIIKMEEELIESEINEHATMFITTNNVESDKIKGYYQKRIFYYELKLTMNRETEFKMSKRVFELIKKIDNSFYIMFIDKMMYKIKGVFDEINTNNPDTNIPDLYKISTEILIQLLDEYSIEKPSYVKVLTLNEFRFNDNTTEKNEKEKIIKNLKYNIEMFTYVKKDDVVEYIPGDKAYVAKNVADLLPDLDADVSGFKVIFKRVIFEKYFNGKFKYDIFGKEIKSFVFNGE